MIKWKNKILALSLAALMMSSMTACETYDQWEARTETGNNQYPGLSSQGNVSSTSSTGTSGASKGPSLADYVNEGLEEAKANGQYHEVDYSSIRTDGSNSGPTASGQNQDGSSGNMSQSGSNATSENSNNASGGNGSYNSGGFGLPSAGGNGLSGYGTSGSDRELTDKEIWARRLDYLACLEFDTEPYVVINDNVPYFTEEELELGRTFAFHSDLIDNTSTFITFSELDELRRTGQAYGLLNESMMPENDIMRGDISFIKPTGWSQARYDWIDNGGWLYNRCHLIAWSFTGEDANEKNLMTGTRYFNVEGMLPFEIQMLKYLDKNTKNHVLYRATPVYYGGGMLAKGLLLEAYSIEDEGNDDKGGLSFCVYIFNAQPGVDIDYNTGKSGINEYMQILLEGE